MKWLEIGSYTEETAGNVLQVNLYEGYNKALIKLDLFSHCIIYCLLNDKLDMHAAKIINADIDTGKLILERQIDSSHSNSEGRSVTGQLVDIKPYFPNEEVILEAEEQDVRFCLNYQDHVLGKYILHGNRTVIQLDKQIYNDSSDGLKLLSLVKKGSFLRILWWFHRFDKDSFRKNRMCNPPYNNAPKTGIFATRSPNRPNPVGSTVVQVQQVDYQNGIIEILGFDGFQGTDIFQIMFYQPSTDRVEGATLPSWVSHWTGYKSFEKPREISLVESDELRKLPDSNDNEIFCADLETEIISEEEYDSQEIHVYNAHIHNLKNISITIPKERISLITGVSGSGKSSLAFDTIFAESQKQFMDLVLSNQLLNDTFSDVNVDKISGLQPSIAIEQRSLGANPRSTVGSVTRIADVLKLLFAAIGERVCPICHNPVDGTNVCSECGNILFDRTPQVFSYNHPDYMCPVCRGLGVEMQIDEELIVEQPGKSLLDSASFLYGDLRKHRRKPNANWMRGEVLALADDMKVDLDVPFCELPEDFRYQFFHGSEGREVSLSYENSKGRSGVITRPVEGAVNLIHRLANDTKSTRGIENVKRFMSKKTCSRCQGERLLEEGRLVNIQGDRYPEVMNLSIDKLRVWCHRIYRQLPRDHQDKGRMLLSKINLRLKRVQDVGLSYITLDRSIPSLSGGEAQRLKLATQFGTGLSDILYIMDEPSKGLHPKDYRFLMEAIVDLKNHGNTVLLVEHKKSFLAIADKHIQMGPKAGRYGGDVTSILDGTEIEQRLSSIECLDDFDSIEVIEQDMTTLKKDPFIELKGVSTNNLRNVDVVLPTEKLIAVIGVSGSGKSSLISKTLFPRLLESLGKNPEEKGRLREAVGIEAFSDVSYVNQKPIGSNSRSNPGTYTGVFDLIRSCYGSTQEAKTGKLSREYFSFNSKKGQCPVCSGLGEVAVNMHYMDDIYIPCTKCHGKRYKAEVLDIKRQGLSIGDILEMEISDLLDYFQEEKEIHRMLVMLEKIGLGYLKLGQSGSTLSGGEAQRIKLAKELYRNDCNKILYILDEPTTGLHDEDIDKVIDVLHELKGKGASVIVIEHNLRLIKKCDYIVELGPEGGDRGGRIVRAGYQQQHLSQV